MRFARPIDFISSGTGLGVRDGGEFGEITGMTQTGRQLDGALDGSEVSPGKEKVELRQEQQPRATHDSFPGVVW